MKKEAMKKFKINKQTAHVISGVVAVLSCVVALFFILNGSSFFKDDNTIQTTDRYKNENISSRKRFTMFIDEKTFTSVKEEDCVTVTAIKDKSVVLTANALHGTSYSALCEKYRNDYTQIYSYAELNVELPYNVYQKETDGLITTVYCIDDGLGSSVEIKYTMPSDNGDYKESFDILLSTFKFLPYEK